MRLVMVACLVMVGCGKTHEFDDSEGRHFRWGCRGKSCDLQDVVTAATATPKPPGSGATPEDKAEFVVPYNAENRYVTVCEAWVSRGKGSAGGGHRHETCRLVTCKADSDCPPEVSMPGAKCVNGACGDPSRKLTQLDYRFLCLAGTGPWTNSEQQQKRLALADAASLPDLKPVPKECRQP